MDAPTQLKKARGNLGLRKWYRSVYLRSPHWLALRAAKLALNPLCERCSAKAGDVHHREYKNIYDVTVDDLESICRTCHQVEHKFIDKSDPDWQAKQAAWAKFGQSQKSERKAAAARANGKLGGRPCKHLTAFMEIPFVTNPT